MPAKAATATAAGDRGDEQGRAECRGDEPAADREQRQRGTVSEHAARLRRSERRAARAVSPTASRRSRSPPSVGTVAMGSVTVARAAMAAASRERAASAASSASRRSAIASCSAASAASRAACSVLVQDALLRRDLAGGRLDAHGLGRLGGLGEDAQGLLQSHRVALGGEVLPAAQPARQEVRDPERGGYRDQDRPRRSRPCANARTPESAWPRMARACSAIGERQRVPRRGAIVVGDARRHRPARARRASAAARPRGTSSATSANA